MASKQKILIVDDKKENLLALSNVLEELDAEIIKATNGNEALKATLNHDFALGILDVQMPEMNGYELAEYIRHEDKTKHLPLIFLSAVYSDDYHVFKGYEAGAVDFVSKPYNPYYLLSKVKIFLQLDRQKKELLENIELEKSKNYLESILMSVNDSIIVLSLDGTMKTVNKAALSFWNYKLDEMINFNVGRLFEEDICTPWLEKFKNHYELKNNSKFIINKAETMIRTKNDLLIPVIVSGSALINREGAVHGAVLIIVDISERKQIEESIRKNKTSLAEAQRIAHLGNWEWDIKRNEIVWSDEIYRIFKLTPQSFDATYEAFISLVHPEDREYVNLSIDNALKEKKTYSIDHRILLPDDEEKYVHEQGEVFSDDNDKPVRIVGTIQDITEQKIAEHEINRRSALLSAINRVLEKSITCDTDEEVAKICLDEAEKITKSKFGFMCEINESGLFDTIAISNPGWEECEISLEKRKELLNNIEIRGIRGTVIKQGKSIIFNDPATHPEWIEPPKGHPQITSFLGVPFKKGSKTMGMIGLGNKSGGFDIADQKDIESLSLTFTEALVRKRAELEIHKFNEKLEQRVIDRTAQLNAANKELEAFAYSVSHDLRAPLRHINGFIDLLRNNIIEKIDEKSKKYMNTIADSARQLGVMIDELLKFSRISRSEITLRKVNTKELIKEIVGELKFDVKDRKIKWRIENIPDVNGDPSLLKIVFTNLLTNAIKYTSLENRAVVDIGLQDTNDLKITLFVRDNGVGFNMKYYDKLFRVFNRLHNEKEFEGIGIGLATVQRIIHRHGGNIWAEGKVNEGATFYIELPKAAGE